MAVSKGKFKDYTKRLVRSWTVGTNKDALTLIVDANGKVGITLGASSGTSKTITRADGATVTKSIKGVGFRDQEAPVAVDGSWLFDVAGVTAGETVGAGATGTPRGTKVYLTSGGALNLTASGNTYVGIIDDGRIVDGVAPVQIGV